jgi:hypothetical protein
MGYCCKYTMKGVLHIIIPHTLKFWRIKFETA